MLACMIFSLGSPPLARGKGKSIARSCAARRITPARAGKRHVCDRAVTGVQDHPRSRGEKSGTRFPRRMLGGSPPLARGKGKTNFPLVANHRITPARAGKRHMPPPKHFSCKDHPRSRGEKIINPHSFLFHSGSPPLARGKVIF